MSVAQMLRRSIVALLWMLAVPVGAQEAASPVGASARPTSEAVAADLGARLDRLQELLDAVRSARGESIRQVAMERHWNALQDYMAASLKYTVQDNSPVSGVGGTGGNDCRVVGKRWTGLSFPGQLRSDDYLPLMQTHLGKMREDIIRLHRAQAPAALDEALRAHWQNNYRFLQTARGLGWMFAGWTPAHAGNPTLPAPQSEGAQLTQAYCTMCHAIPQTRLHTESEWSAVMTAMRQHMLSSDSGLPMCVRPPSDEELRVIHDYLVKYAR